MRNPGFHLITFGCQMNVNDSAWVARSLRKLGFEETSLEAADLVLVNTCSVRDKPEQKVYSTLGRIKQLNPKAVVGVSGCVAQQLGESIMDKHPQVRLVAGSDGIVQAPAAFARLLDEPGLRLSFLDFTASYPDRDPCLGSRTGCAGQTADGGGRENAAQHGAMPETASAFVNIMQGCDNFCAYCIVPFTRGPRKSRPTSSILDECKAWLDLGVSEITLLGQNVNVFGEDASADGTSFPQLLRMVAALPGLARLRFVTPHPRDFSPATIEAMGDLPQICPRLHLPLQSGSSRVLEKMGRGYSMETYLDLVSRLRAARPDLALSTDLIVGFPGESEEDFCETLAAVDSAGFMSSFSFCYSDRPGTKASAMGDKIPREMQLERLDRLQSLQNDRSTAWLESRVGLETEMLVEGPSPRQDDGEVLWQGRDAWGDVVHLRLAQGRVGMRIPIRITDAKKHSLLAVVSSSISGEPSYDKHEDTRPNAGCRE